MKQRWLYLLLLFSQSLCRSNVKSHYPDGNEWLNDDKQACLHDALCYQCDEWAMGFDKHCCPLNQSITRIRKLYHRVCSCWRCTHTNTHLKSNLLSLQARIKKIMQTDEEIGKVAAAVPVIICILSAQYLHSLGLDHFYHRFDGIVMLDLLLPSFIQSWLVFDICFSSVDMSFPTNKFYLNQSVVA